jgi:hypothetical protein
VELTAEMNLEEPTETLRTSRISPEVLQFAGIEELTKNNRRVRRAKNESHKIEQDPNSPLMATADLGGLTDRERDVMSPELIVSKK